MSTTSGLRGMFLFVGGAVATGTVVGLVLTAPPSGPDRPVAPSTAPPPVVTQNPQPVAPVAPVAAARCRRPGAAIVRHAGKAMRGGSIALDPTGRTAAVADTDADSVTLLDVRTDGVQARHRFSVGRSPTQVLVDDEGRVFVTERALRRVSVYDGADGHKLCDADVATDPFGLALSPDGRTVYVTSGISHTLTALDTDSLATRFAVDVAREPRAVVPSADGARVFLTHIAGAPLSVVDVGANPRARVLPEVPVPSDSSRGGTAQPIPSQAWAAAVDDGMVVLPFMVSRTGREIPPQARLDVYGGGSVDPVVSEKVSFVVATFDPVRETWRTVTLPAGGFSRNGFTPGMPRIPMDVAVRPTDHALLVASTGTGELATLSRADAALAVDGVTEATPTLRRTPQNSRLLTHHPPGAIVSRATVALPQGIAVTPEGASLVWSQADHAVEFVPANSTALSGPQPQRVSVGADVLAPDVARGRRLFYTANDPRITSGGLSCGGCHPDGRDDGLVWFLSHGPRQTPMLAGRLVEPFNWEGSHRSLAANISQTIHRLGGTGLPIDDVDALVAWITRGLTPPDAVPSTAGMSRIAHGRELFATTAGCAICHDPGRNFTDGQAHELGGLRGDETVRAFDTPSLRYVSATAPYFHDGRYATLRAMLIDPTHRMGHANALVPDDVDALESYLMTL